MKNGEDDDIEKKLKSVALKPAPPGLRERVLRAAQERKEATAWTTPLLRKCLAGCAVAVVAVFITDAILGRRQQNSLQALLHGSSLTQIRTHDEGRALAEVLGDSVGLKMLGRRGRGPSHPKDGAPADRGSILKKLLKEDFIDNEISENLH